MEALEPGLYVGTLPACLDEEALRQADITALVCCGSSAPSTPSFIDDSHTFHVPLDETDTSPLYLYFGLSARFIQKQREEQRHVLLYGAEGETCHSTLAAAYTSTHNRQRRRKRWRWFVRGAPRPSLLRTSASSMYNKLTQTRIVRKRAGASDSHAACCSAVPTYSHQCAGRLCDPRHAHSSSPRYCKGPLQRSCGHFCACT